MATKIMAPLAAQGYPSSLKEKEEKSFYANLIRLRDEVVAGTHPRLSAKLLDPRIDSFPPLPFPLPPPPLLPHESQGPREPDRNKSNGDGLGSKYPTMANGQSSAAPRGFASQIDPVLLTKSDDLIRAETELKRQRIERALKDQVDQRHKESTHKSSNSDILPDFDVTEILRQAHARVKPTTAQDESDPESNSVDDDTFYSSVDNRSSPGIEARSNQTSNASQTQLTGLPDESSSQQAVLQDTAFKHPTRGPQKARGMPAKLDRRVQVNADSPTERQDAFGRMIREPDQRKETLDDQTDERVQPPGLGLDLKRNHVPSFEPPAKETSQESFDPYTQPQTSQEVPFIANQITTPVAPQPARISPIARAKEPPYIQSSLRRRNASPAQETQPSSANQRRSSNDSPRQLNPRKKRRIASDKGRKVSNRVPAESPEMYIKPEPDSPPLLSAAPIPQPKRRQQAQGNTETYVRRPFSPLSPRSRITYGPLQSRYEDDARPPIRSIQGPPHTEYVRIVRDSNEPRRYIENHLPPPVSPFGTRYPLSEERPVRAVSQYVERPTMSRSGYYVDGVPDSRPHYFAMERPRSPIVASERYSPTPIRMSMAPPPVTRITLDKYGREYMTSDPPQIVRHTPVPATLREPAPSQLRQSDVESRPISYQVQSHTPHAAYHDEPRYVEMPPPRPMSTVRNLQDQPVTTMYRPREYSTVPTEVSSVAGGYVRPQEPRPYSPSQGREPSFVPRNQGPTSPGNEGRRGEYVRQTHSIGPGQGHRIYDRGLTLDTARPDGVPAAQHDFGIRIEDAGLSQLAPSSSSRYVVPPQRFQYIEEPRYAERPRDSLPEVYGHTVEMLPRR